MKRKLVLNLDIAGNLGDADHDRAYSAIAHTTWMLLRAVSDGSVNPALLEFEVDHDDASSTLSGDLNRGWDRYRNEAGWG